MTDLARRFVRLSYPVWVVSGAFAMMIIIPIDIFYAALGESLNPRDWNIFPYKLYRECKFQQRVDDLGGYLNAWYR